MVMLINQKDIVHFTSHCQRLLTIQGKKWQEPSIHTELELAWGSSCEKSKAPSIHQGCLFFSPGLLFAIVSASSGGSCVTPLVQLALGRFHPHSLSSFEPSDFLVVPLELEMFVSDAHDFILK